MGPSRILCLYRCYGLLPVRDISYILIFGQGKGGVLNTMKRTKRTTYKGNSNLITMFVSFLDNIFIKQCGLKKPSWLHSSSSVPFDHDR